MPLPTTYINATLHYGSDDDEAHLNVLWYEPLAAVSITDPQAFATLAAATLAAFFDSGFLGWLAVDCRWLGATVNLHHNGVTFVGKDTTGAGPGTVTGDSLPDYAAAIIQKRTNQPGKEGRGRWYIGCVPEGVTDTGQLTPTGLTNLGVLEDALGSQQNLSGVQWAPRHYSKKNNALYPIVAMNSLRVLGTQRRRRLRQPLL